MELSDYSSKDSRSGKLSLRAITCSTCCHRACLVGLCTIHPQSNKFIVDEKIEVTAGQPCRCHHKYNACVRRCPTQIYLKFKRHCAISLNDRLMNKQSEALLSKMGDKNNFFASKCLFISISYTLQGIIFIIFLY